MPDSAEEIEKELEEIEKLAEDEAKKDPELELKQLETIFNGLERLADKYIEYKRSMFPQEKELELTKHKYWVGVTLGVTGLIAVVLVMILVLSLRNVMSSEGVSFLLGTIVGYLFSTLSMVINGLLKPNNSKE